MATDYKKYILSTGTHYISNSGSDENGGTRGGKAGDQNGKEWRLRSFYVRPWTCVLRYPNMDVGTLIAQLGIDAALNDKIGYDQGQRDTFWKEVKKVGYLPAKIKTACEEDCTAGVNGLVHCAGYLLDIPALKALAETGIRSSNMKKAYKAAGFKVLTDSKYLKSGDYLLPGDILLYENHHAATNVTCGKKVRGDYTYHDVIANPSAYRPTPTPTPTPVKLGDRVLKYGDSGADVKLLQEDLMRLGYDLPEYGADGDFGSETDRAVRHFQQEHGLSEDGVMDDEDYSALFAALDGEKLVEITGSSVNVRSAPNTDSNILGTVHAGDRLPYQGVTQNVDGRDWYLVEFENQNGWVSSRYAKLIDGGGRGSKIVDLSKYEPTIDYDALIADTALIILRAGYRSKDGNIYEDQKFEKHAAALTKRGVRFGVYFYSIADTEDKALEEARMFYKFAKGFGPLFWAMDAEKTVITKDTIVAFVDELRKLGAKKVGCYVANHLYTKYDYASIRDKMDYTWIPKYKADPPKYPCDLWQFTDKGRVNGIDEEVDLSRITGQGHTLEWFTS